MSRHLAALLALGALAAPLGAQGPTVRRGAEVQISARARSGTGRLVDLSPTAIIVANRYGKIRTLPRSEIRQIKVREGGRWIAVAPEQLPSALAAAEGPVTADGRVVAPGTRLRITSGRRSIVGPLAEWRGDTLFLARDDGTPSAVPIEPNTRIQVSAGRHGAAMAGFVTGFVLGAAGGAAGGAGACSASWGSSGDCGGAAVGGAVMGGIILGGLGAGIGSAIRSERWIEVPADSVRSYVAADLLRNR
jgi:hypothetical protein